MGRFTSTMLFVLIWWIALFAVLPFGTRPKSGADETSGWRGVPAQVHLPRKLIATTLLAACIWMAFHLVISNSGLSFRSGFLALPAE